jgi:hypothetical protein
VEVRAGATLLGRTAGSGVFTAAVPSGTQTLRVTQGSDTREIVQVFQPGRTVTLDWTSVAPGVKATVVAPRVDPSEQKWEAVSAATDPSLVRAFIHDYPNAHTADAQSLLDSLVWRQTGPNDAAALQSYLKQFPNGQRAGDARSLLDDIAWRAVDQTSVRSLQSFLQQNPWSLHQREAQTRIDQLEMKLGAALPLIPPPRTRWAGPGVNPTNGSRWSKWRFISQAILSYSVAADLVSSLGFKKGFVEENPLYGPPAHFGLRQGLILSGLSTGSLVGQWWTLKHEHPKKMERVMMFGDLGAAGVHEWAFWHNMRER